MTVKKKIEGVKITVLGAGSWGTTLAVLLRGKGYPVTLWEYFPELAERLRREGENKMFLPGIPIPRSITVTSSIDEALEGSTDIFFVTPSHTVRSVAGIRCCVSR